MELLYSYQRVVTVGASPWKHNLVHCSSMSILLPDIQYDHYGKKEMQNNLKFGLIVFLVFQSHRSFYLIPTRWLKRGFLVQFVYKDRFFSDAPNLIISSFQMIIYIYILYIYIYIFIRTFYTQHHIHEKRKDKPIEMIFFCFSLISLCVWEERTKHKISKCSHMP